MSSSLEQAINWIRSIREEEPEFGLRRTTSMSPHSIHGRLGLCPIAKDGGELVIPQYVIDNQDALHDLIVDGEL